MDDSGQGWPRYISARRNWSARAGLARAVPMGGISTRGIGLPEALIALALLGIALNGLLAAHWQARNLQLDAAARQHVVLALHDFATRWRLNPSGEATYRLALSQPLPRNVSADVCQWQACSPEARAQADISALAMQLQQLLVKPEWHFEPCTDALASCLLVAWAGTEASSGPEGSCLDASGQRRPGAQCARLLLP